MNAKVPKFIHDTHRISEVNAAACALFRCEADALVDRDMLDLLVNPDFVGLARLRLSLLRDRKYVPNMKYKYRRFDGSIFWASVSSRYLGDGMFETVLTYEGEK